MIDHKAKAIKAIDSLIRCEAESADNAKTVRDWKGGKVLPAIKAPMFPAKRSTPVFGKRKAY